MFCLHLCFNFYSRAREEREEARCDRRMNGAPLRHVVSIKKRACHHKVTLPSLSCAATSLSNSPEPRDASDSVSNGPEPREVSDAVPNSYEPRSYGESCHAQVCYFNGGRFLVS